MGKNIHDRTIDRTLLNRAFARSVARHTTMPVPENEGPAHRIDYKAAVFGGLRLVPARMPLEVPADGMPRDTGNFFERLLEPCAETTQEPVDPGKTTTTPRSAHRAPPGSARTPGCWSTGLSAAGDQTINGLSGLAGQTARYDPAA